MSTIPARPRKYPTKWISAFWYFDRGSTGFNLSDPTPHDSKEAAIAAAKSAHNQNGAAIRVLYGYAYPPVGAKEELYVVNLQ